MWIIALMAAGAYLGKEHPVGVSLAVLTFVSLLILLIVNPALGAATVLLTVGLLLTLIFIPFIIGYALGIAFFYFLAVGLLELIK